MTLCITMHCGEREWEGRGGEGEKEGGERE